MAKKKVYFESLKPGDKVLEVNKFNLTVRLIEVKGVSNRIGDEAMVIFSDGSFIMPKRRKLIKYETAFTTVWSDLDSGSQGAWKFLDIINIWSQGLDTEKMVKFSQFLLNLEK